LWLADVSGMSLDWQKLPGDYLNLVTQRSYTLDEARDLINRRLLARGYTIVHHGEVLSVVKLEDLNPGMVPRVEPDELDQRDPHEFVKVSFPLDWMLAETAVGELQPMLTAHGKLNPLKTTNRLEAIDAVVNPRRNSILAHAPPDKMAIIEQAIVMLDVPTGMGESLLLSMHRMQIYRLAAIDPEPLVKTLEALGELDPRTRLEVDEEHRVIIAYATAADHVVIRALVDQLDGSGRRFDVIPLRRLAADPDQPRAGRPRGDHFGRHRGASWKT